MAETSDKADWAALFDAGGRVFKRGGRLVVSVGGRGARLDRLQALQARYGGTITTSYVLRPASGRAMIDDLWPELAPETRARVLAAMVEAGGK